MYRQMRQKVHRCRSELYFWRHAAR